MHAQHRDVLSDEHSAPASPADQMKRVGAAGFTGTLIEFYDLQIYTTAAALVFAHVFFPQLGKAAATVAAMRGDHDQVAPLLDRVNAAVDTSEYRGFAARAWHAAGIAGLREPDSAQNIAKRIRDELAVPFEVDELHFKVTASIGISVFPDDGVDPLDGEVWQSGGQRL